MTSEDDNLLFDLLDITGVCANELEHVHLEFLMGKFVKILKEKIKIVLPWVQEIINNKSECLSDILIR